MDQKCRIPAKCAFFAQVMRESRKLKTGWRMVQSGANHYLVRNSLITRENTGNLPFKGSTAAQSLRKSTDSAGTYLAIPCSNLTGNLISSNREWLGVIREKASP